MTASMPCEPHCDAGAFTLSIPSLKLGDGPCEGLQIELPTALPGAANKWLDAEAVMVEQNAVLIFAGEVLGHISRGQVRLPPHRVVRLHGAAPRYSCIYEVIPHPSKPVPMMPSTAAAAPVANSSVLTGHDVFLLRSVGRESVNWKQQ
jgi:isopenicillin N synthase-like dioxygenase